MIDVDNIEVEQDTDRSFVLGDADAALICRNVDKETIDIEIIIPNIDPVPTLATLLIVVAHRLKDDGFVDEQLSHLTAMIEQLNAISKGE